MLEAAKVINQNVKLIWEYCHFCSEKGVCQHATCYQSKQKKKFSCFKYCNTLHYCIDFIVCAKYRNTEQNNFFYPHNYYALCTTTDVQ